MNSSKEFPTANIPGLGAVVFGDRSKIQSNLHQLEELKLQVTIHEEAIRRHQEEIRKHQEAIDKLSSKREEIKTENVRIQAKIDAEEAKYTFELCEKIFDQLQRSVLRLDIFNLQTRNYYSNPLYAQNNFSEFPESTKLLPIMNFFYDFYGSWLNEKGKFVLEIEDKDDTQFRKPFIRVNSLKLLNRFSGKEVKVTGDMHEGDHFMRYCDSKDFVEFVLSLKDGDGYKFIVCKLSKIYQSSVQKAPNKYRLKEQLIEAKTFRKNGDRYFQSDLVENRKAVLFTLKKSLETFINENNYSELLPLLECFEGL